MAEQEKVGTDENFADFETREGVEGEGAQAPLPPKRDEEAAGGNTPPPDTPKKSGGKKGADGNSPPKAPPKNGEEGKVLVRHPGKAAKKVIVGETLVVFDKDGIASLDAEAAEYLLGIPGYEKAE